MGVIGIIARRFDDKKHVQYGWCGNSGNYSFTGKRLLEWYDDPEVIEYLFGLGQMALLGKPGSENGGAPMMLCHQPTGEPHHVSVTERSIFSQIAFIDVGYFYDCDQQWYYIIPGPFRIKMPLKLVANNLDGDGNEYDLRGTLRAGTIDRSPAFWKVMEDIRNVNISGIRRRDKISTSYLFYNYSTQSSQFSTKFNPI